MRLRIFSAIILFLLFLLLLLAIDIIVFLNKPLVPKNATAQDYVFHSGTPIRVLAHDLHIKRPLYFEGLAYLRGYARHLHAGEYRFSPGITPEKLLKQIAEGKVLWRQITFIEGWTFTQMQAVLDKNTLITHLISHLPRPLLVAELKLPGVYPEGLFFPATYRYTAGMSDKEILAQARHALVGHLQAEWKNRDKNLPYITAYEALIVASIIEKEAYLNRERPEIAGVIIRRLQKNMPLQMNSTVTYAMEHNDDAPKFSPKKNNFNINIESLYNTYRYKGLPPTPICMPSLASLHAAMHPDAGNSLYFVARNDGSGSHQFSATYAEHKAAVQKFL